MTGVIRPGERWDAVCDIPDDESEAEWNCTVALKLVEWSEDIEREDCNA